jgi:hypothetical protein
MAAFGTCPELHANDFDPFRDADLRRRPDLEECHLVLRGRRRELLYIRVSVPSARTR